MGDNRGYRHWRMPAPTVEVSLRELASIPPTTPNAFITFAASQSNGCGKISFTDGHVGASWDSVVVISVTPLDHIT